MACRCGCGAGEADMDQDFMSKVVAMRIDLDMSMPVSSAYRCPRYNRVISSTGLSGPHTTGQAIDINVSRSKAVAVLEYVYKSGLFTGVGINQRGKGRFIHLDDLENSSRPAIWSY